MKARTGYGITAICIWRGLANTVQPDRATADDQRDVRQGGDSGSIG